MADNTEILLRDLTNSPEFVHELLPAAERTALLYHLTYLCLANFPKLERIIRARALETQRLFCSSETLLLKCVTTSDDLVSSLLPMLKLAIKSNKTALAVKSLDKARTWINEIVQKVKEIINRYEEHNQSVASCTSDVITEKKETEAKKAENTTEMKRLEGEVTELKNELQKNLEEITKIEAKVQEKNAELKSHVNEICNITSGLSIMAMLVPFVGPVIKTVHDIAKTKSLTSELSQLSSEKSDLRRKEWQIQINLTDQQLKLTNLKIEDGTIPDPIHLGDVQQCLSQIQQVLIQLQNFWESVSELLGSLQKKTFVAEDVLESANMDEETKKFFLESIDHADKYWKTFGHGCLKARSIFNIQTKDAYKFLEFVPPLGSEEWKQQYESVMKRLNNINPDPYCNQEAKIAEITQ